MNELYLVCVSVLDPDPDSNGQRIVPGSKQAKIAPKIGINEKISSRLKSSVLGWKLLLEPECPL